MGTAILSKAMQWLVHHNISSLPGFIGGRLGGLLVEVGRVNDLVGCVGEVLVGRPPGHPTQTKLSEAEQGKQRRIKYTGN